MKKLILILLAISSFSAFADEDCGTIRKVKQGLTVRITLRNEKTGNDSNYTLWEDITDKGSVVTAMQSGLRTCVTYVPETAPNTLSMVMSIEYGL